MIKRRIKETVTHQGIGGKEFIIDEEVTRTLSNDSVYRMGMGGNPACLNFILRRKDFNLDFAYPLYYGKVGGLGYVVAADELITEEIPKEPERKVYISTTNTPFEGLPTELVEAISDDLHDAAKMFRRPYCDEATEEKGE